MPRPRTLPASPVSKSCVIGLAVGTGLAPLMLAMLNSGETSAPPAAFITVAVFCWGLVPRVFIEFLPPLLVRAGAVSGPEAPATETAREPAADRR